MPAAHRAARDGRPLGAAARARHRPHPPRPRRRRAAARPARRGHPRRGGQRAQARRLRRGLQGALGLRGLRSLPARLLRRGPGRRPVRHRRRRSTGCAPSPSSPPTPSRTAVSLAATDPANPYGAALPWPRQPARATAATGPAARPAPWSCWSTARSRSTSSAAAAPCSPGPTTPTGSPPPPPPWPTPPGAAPGPAHRREGRRRALLGGGSTPLREALEAAGFVATPRDCGCAVPEGDTVFRAARLLDRSLTGQALTRTDFRVPAARHRRPRRRRPSSRRVSRGKHLLTRLDRPEQRAAGPCTPTSRWRAPGGC